MLLAGGTVLTVFAVGQLALGWNVSALADRFVDLDGIMVNASDRWWTISTSFDLMIRNPIGMGSTYVEPLEVATGTSATHNAFLELALMGGIPLMLFVIFRLFKAASALRTVRAPVEAWLAAYLIGIFAFESFFLQVNVQLLIFWLLISPLKPIAMQRGVRAVAPVYSVPGTRVGLDWPRRRAPR